MAYVRNERSAHKWMFEKEYNNSKPTALKKKSEKKHF